MAAKKSARRTAQKSAKGTTAEGDVSTGFTAEERAAMRERAQEVKAAARSRAKGESEEGAVLAKIAAMGPADRAMGERLHAIMRASAPELSPRLWYGRPAYAKDVTVRVGVADRL